jgi:NAD(P)-dependent dehydrogenase (short-subunit alcohol dehydrogenase family)
MTSTLVTGSAGGIGQAICWQLHKAGWKVVGLDHQAIPHFVPWDQRACDLADLASLVGIANDLPGDLGAIIHAAADQPLLRAQENARDEWARAWNVNVGALQVLVSATFDRLIATSPSRVITIGSIHGSHTSVGMAPYSVTKSALAAYVRALAVDGAQEGITAINIELGAAHSPKLQQGLSRWGPPRESLARLESRLPTRRLIEPIEVAQMVDWLLTDAGRHCTGSSVPFSGGVAALLATEIDNGSKP